MIKRQMYLYKIKIYIYSNFTKKILTNFFFFFSKIAIKILLLEYYNVSIQLINI